MDRARRPGDKIEAWSYHPLYFRRQCQRRSQFIPKQLHRRRENRPLQSYVVLTLVKNQSLKQGLRNKSILHLLATVNFFREISNKALNWLEVGVGKTIQS